MASKVFIDGAAGTTGLEIRERLADRADLALVQLSDRDRKDLARAPARLNEADIVILCLPDDAAREAVGLIENPAVRVIDASTAHRVAPRAGPMALPSLKPIQRAQHRGGASSSANPGCYPTAFWRWSGRWCAQASCPAISR